MLADHRGRHASYGARVALRVDALGAHRRAQDLVELVHEVARRVGVLEQGHGNPPRVDGPSNLREPARGRESLSTAVDRPPGRPGMPRCGG